jgi:pimeloyl-ACP methyl ester carboxylesterase
MKPFLSPITISLVLLSAILVSSISVPQKTSLWSSGFASAKDGTSIFYTTSGKGRTALVFVHGWTCDHTYWRKQLDHFAQNYQVVALDLAGHGKSGSNRKAYTMKRFGDDVAAVMETLKLNHVVLIGHSMGGPTIVEAARQMPEKVIGLVGVDTFQDLEQHLTAEQIDKMLQPVRADYTGAVRYIVRTTMFVPGSDSLLAEQITTHMSSARPEIGIDAVRNLFEWKGEEAFNALSIPKWTINSDYQKTNTEVAAKYGLKVELMSGVGHFVMLEDAQTFNKLLSGIIIQMERK